MKVSVIIKDIAAVPADVLVINEFEGVTKPGGATGAVDKALGGLVSKQLKQSGFKGAFGETMEVQPHGRIPAGTVLVLGLGKREKLSYERVRKLSAAAARWARGRGKTVATILHGAGIGGLDAKESAKAMTEGALLAAYHFGKYKHEEDRKELAEYQIVQRDRSKLRAVQEGIWLGTTFAEATIIARDLVNEPPSELTPAKLARTVSALLKGTGLRVTVYDQPAIRRMGMNAFLAVSKGSAEAPRFIHIVYKPGIKPKKKTAIVGKGITFDSGGLSLKPAEHMTTMKMDMAGAAAMIGTMWALAKLKPAIEVHGITALTENMPGGGAYKVDDIVRAMNGKTIEIGNTDAEGRVTLADALSYAAKLKPDEIIDLATLTGACIVALGDEYAGLMGQGGLPERLVEAAKKSGELMWPLPLPEEYRDHLKSTWADLHNAPTKRGAGAITAGLFLKEFVGTTPWAHLDIAGPAFSPAESFYKSKEGTGYGVRTLLTYLTQ